MPRTLTVRQTAQFRQRVVKDAVRRKNISETARVFRVSRQTVHRWQNRYDGTLLSLIDRSKRPRSHPKAHTQEEIDTVVRYFTHNKRLGLVCLWVRLKQNAGYTRSLPALYRLLRKKGLLLPPAKRRKRKNKPYQPILVPGERFQMDVKHVPRECLVGALAGRRLFQYTAIDECTRWRHVAVFTEQSTYNSVLFTKELLKAFPFEVQCIQTDNGSEFTSRLQGATHTSAFEDFLEVQGIRHKRIAVATPRHNGKVERSHRSDQERFYNGSRFFSLQYITKEIKRYLTTSNNLPLAAHQWKSANQTLNNYRALL